jgi:hypothetical protein
MRWIGLDCHLEFIEVAILDPAGALVSAGRIESGEEAIGLFAEGAALSDGGEAVQDLLAAPDHG